MIKIKYVGTAGSIGTSGRQFKKGIPYEVTKEVAEYLKNTFGDNFEVIEIPKPKATPKPKPKPKAEPKVDDKE